MVKHSLFFNKKDNKTKHGLQQDSKLENVRINLINCVVPYAYTTVIQRCGYGPSLLLVYLANGIILALNHK